MLKMTLSYYCGVGHNVITHCWGLGRFHWGIIHLEMVLQTHLSKEVHKGVHTGRLSSSTECRLTYLRYY